MRVLLSILFVFCSVCCKADAYFCSYYLRGKITNNSGEAVVNAQCTLKLGINYRFFQTDSDGNYFVEVLYMVAAPCRYDIDGKPLSDELQDSREANSDTLIISCHKVAASIKANWEKYYFREKKHFPSEKYEGLDLIETKNVVLNPIERPSKSDRFYEQTELAIKQTQSKLRDINNTIRVDSIKMFADRQYINSYRFKLQNGYEYELEVDSSDITEYDDPNGGRVISYGHKADPFQKYVHAAFDINWGLIALFSYIDIRNRHISYLFSDDFFGNCKEIILLKPTAKHRYILPTDQFKKDSSFFNNCKRQRRHYRCSLCRPFEQMNYSNYLSYASIVQFS